jgi:hypothetical protein
MDGANILRCQTANQEKKMDQSRRCRGGRRLHRVVLVALPLLIALFITGAVSATENGGSVYPIGVETVLPGLCPPPHGTMFYEFTAYVSANQLDNQYGNVIPMEFKLRVFANAVKVNRNWGWRFLGGTVESMVAIPFVDQSLHVPPGKFSKFAVGNMDVSPLGVVYAKGNWYFYYEADLWFPGTGRSSNDVLNIGQNNYAAGPVGAFTYLHKKEELSSKFQYIINRQDTAAHYQSGNEFTWEFDGMHAVTRKIAVGVNGYLYKQTTDDLQNNLVFNDGNRGRALAIGPEVRFNLIHHGGFAVKYLRDTLTQNRPPVNAFWFQMAVPITIGHKE